MRGQSGSIYIFTCEYYSIEFTSFSGKLHNSAKVDRYVVTISYSFFMLSSAFITVHIKTQIASKKTLTKTNTA